MKVRNGFVSNSSSSSFIILQSSMNEKQKEMLFDHIEIAKEIDKKLKSQGKPEKYEYYEEWYMEEDDFSVWCHTSMDNFYLIEFLISEAGLDGDDIIEMGDDLWNEKLFETEEYQEFKKMKTRGKKLDKLKDNIDETGR